MPAQTRSISSRGPRAAETSSAESAHMAADTAAAPRTTHAIAEQVQADEQLPRRQWLQRIRLHRDSGDPELARASLERYLQHYPGPPVPQDLRDLLER